MTAPLSEHQGAAGGPEAALVGELSDHLAQLQVAGVRFGGVGGSTEPGVALTLPGAACVCVRVCVCVCARRIRFRT